MADSSSNANNTSLKTLQELGMSDCNETSTPATLTTAVTADSEEPRDSGQHSQYRRVVGQLQWEAPVRPDCAFTIKECARYLHGTTVALFRRL